MSPIKFYYILTARVTLCYTGTGSFTAIPTYMCEKTRAYLDLARRELEKL